MSNSLAERLEAARRRQFVGRSSERELIRGALAAPELPFALLYLFGPGGVGKTTLLREAAHVAEQMALQAVRLDGRNLEASPEGFLAGLRAALGPDAAAEADVYARLAAPGRRALLLIDTAELLSPLDAWLRDTFLPRLPDNVLVIMAGRNPPSPRWRTDPGWQALMRVLPLRNLSQDESRAFLMRRQVPATAHASVLQFTHGHPLALSLVADVLAQQPDVQFRPEAAPDVIKTLLDQFVQDAPSGLHRATLAACSQVRLLNETLLGELIKVDDPHPYFEWLRGLSFVDAEPRGLFPHDLAREALTADLRWRNPAFQAALHARARSYYMARFEAGDAREQRRVLSDYIYLHRDNPVIQPVFEWQSTGTVFTAPFRKEDTPQLLEMVRAHEGETAVAIAAHWLARQPKGAAVFRETVGTPQGLLQMVALDKTTEADRAADPGTAAAWRFLTSSAPLRGGETATLFRFWMARDTYQAVSPVQSRIFLNMVQHYLTTPGLAYTFIPCADPAFWTAVFGFADLHRLPAADFEMDGRSYGVYGHDWRETPPMKWLALMAERELGPGAPEAESAELPVTRVLSQEAFAAAVRDALRDLGNVVALQANPLLESRVVLQAAGAGGALDRAQVLRSLLQEAAETMRAHPRQAKWHRALYHTFIQPAPTQERAAELLDLPFSTYRRYLRHGVAYVTEWLWLQEVQG